MLAARIGVTESERAAAQSLEAEIAIEADLEKAGLSDALSDTINYADIRHAALAMAASRTWSLLEALAERIAADLLARFAAAASVTVTLRKPDPPFMSGVDTAGVTIVRRRGAPPAVP